MSLIIKEEELKNKQIIECICKNPYFSCPYHFHNYYVYLCGSWNNWMSTIAFYKDNYYKDKFGNSYENNKYTAEVPKNLKKEIYEYKWKFINKTTGETFWTTNVNRKTIINNGWNQNNLYYVNHNFF